MDVQRKNPYVSCIKIRGIPIIAPLMTEDLRIEMKYYKQLALAVEDRLKSVEAAACLAGESPEVGSNNDNSLTEESSDCEIYLESREKVDRATTYGTDLLTNRESKKVSLFQTGDNRDFRLSEATGGTTSWKSFSDEETNCCNESSDAITASTDVNRYVNGSLKSDESSSCALKSSSETRKPVAPTTLDIVPITVDAPVRNTVADHLLEQSDKIIEKQLSGSDLDVSQTPKLVRQGSYVLDSPSPMLLAHLQEDNGNCVVSDNPVKRREWNLSGAKSEWELHKKNEDYMIRGSLGDLASNSKGRLKRTSSTSNGRINKSFSECRGRGTRSLGDSRQFAKSIDCIQSILHKENDQRNVLNKITGGQKGSSKSNGSINERWKNIKSISVLNLTDELGGSLGNLSRTNRFGKRAPNMRFSNRLSKSFEIGGDREKLKCEESIRVSTQKLLSTVTSEKLVRVFREIQNTHELQMTELIVRQREEQQKMQKEFERQQLLLLAQIERTFPGMSLRRLVERVSPGHLGSENAVGCPDRSSPMTPLSTTSPTAPPTINGSHLPAVGENSKCPLDDIYPRENLNKSSAYRPRENESTCGRVVEPKSPPLGLYSTSVTNAESRSRSVSRQLFPLEAKTYHVPIPNRAIYQERHVNAANVINAYARGYLTRRLLKTDRVIALKTTYKEALHCMLKLHVDAPLALPELNFHQRLQLQCDAASMNIVELFEQEAARRMEIIRQDRQIKRARQERPNSARSYSFATQRTLARKKLKEYDTE